MSSSRSSKRELERLRREKAARKLEKRKARSELEATQVETDGEAVPQDVVLADLAALHQRYSDDEISSEDFETERDRLLAQLRVD